MKSAAKTVVFPGLILLLASLLTVEAAVSVSSTVQSSWDTGKTIGLTFTNTGSSAICAVTFSVSLPSGTTISSSWNLDAVSGTSGQYTLPTWLNIAAGGGSYVDTGMNLSGTGTPSFAVVSSTACSASGTTTTTTSTVAGTTTTTTKAAAYAATTTTTTTKAATATTKTITAVGTTTTTTAATSSGTTLVVSPDSTNTALNSCYESSAIGPITSVLNQPITGAKFTFYGASGTGACGMNSGLPSMSAAASGDLFNSNAVWVANCAGSSQWILNDSICMNKCIRITYTCVGCTASKTLTVPINNQCPECEQNHVDLSESAFLWLEPQGGTVGIATDATITYIECP